MRPLPLLVISAALALGVTARGADLPETTIDCTGLAESVSTDTETTTTFHDQVIAVGNGIKLDCDFLKVVTTRISEKGTTLGKHDNFKYMLATGHVKIIQGDRVATCGRADVYPGEDRVVLTENPTVTIASEGYSASSPRMTLYRGQRRAVLEGEPNQHVHISLPAIKDLGFPAEKPAK
jgi:lipopolysaccharide export system protein LptA